MPNSILLRLYLAALVSLITVSAVSAGSLENGAAVYYDHGCYSCHGYNGTGRTPLANNESGMLINEDVFIAFLRQRADRNPTLPDNSMPNFSVNALSDDKARDVYAYIKTFVDEPPALEDIPTFVKILEAAKEGKTVE